MSYLKDNPELMMEVLAKLVHRAGGYVKVSGTDHPSGPFSLLSRINPDDGTCELQLADYGETKPTGTA